MKRWIFFVFGNSLFLWNCEKNVNGLLENSLIQWNSEFFAKKNKKSMIGVWNNDKIH